MVSGFTRKRLNAQRHTCHAEAQRARKGFPSRNELSCDEREGGEGKLEVKKLLAFRWLRAYP
jgi:hypothetical protein